MKRFKDPKWETFSKCYEDCLKYRLTRRVMEGSHKPWFWEGWDSSSESSGWSTPRGSKNRVAPLSAAFPDTAASPDTAEVTERLQQLKTSPGSSPGARHRSEGEAPEVEPRGGERVDGAVTGEAVVQNGPNESHADIATVPNINGYHYDTTTDNGPIDSASSDGEVLRPRPRHRRPLRNRDDRAARSHDDRAVVRKAPRAKSQPPTSSKDKERLDWTQTHMEARRTPNNTSDACIQTGRPKTGLRSSMRRARSADLEKIRKSQLTVADDRWVTEYMRCFSARVR